MYATNYHRASSVADAAKRRYGLETMVRSYLDLLE